MSKTYAALQFLNTLSVSNTQQFHLLPCFIAPFKPGYDIAASCDECERDNTVSFSLFRRRRMWLRTGQESRWPPRLSGLFKEHFRRSPKSNKPTTLPGVISDLPHLLFHLDTSRFNASFKSLHSAVSPTITQ